MAAVGDQLQPPEEPPAPDVADVRMRTEAAAQPCFERLAQPLHLRDQVPFAHARCTASAAAQAIG